MVSVKQSSVLVTGVRLELYFQRLLKKTSDIGDLPVHWRILLSGSSRFNACNQDVSAVGYKMKSALDGDVSLLMPSVGVELRNAHESGGSILLRSFMYGADSDCFRDRYGTLQPGEKTCHKLKVWIPIKKRLYKDDSILGKWSYNVYFTLMLELGGVGNKYYKEEGFAAFQGKSIVYYK